MRTRPNIQQDLDAFFGNRGARDAELRTFKQMTLADAQQAVRVVCQRAGEWGVDPQRIGFMGFSAGGWVTTQIALDFTLDSHPSFAAPIYAAVFEGVKAPQDAPPLFLLYAADDEMASRASLILYSAWKTAHRSAEMHIYACGGHGFGMRKLGLPSDAWIERMYEWMKKSASSKIGS